MELLEAIVHLITFITVLLPIYFGYDLFTGKVGNNIRRVLSSGRMGKEVRYIVYGIIIIAIYHFFEVLQVFGINLIPAEGTFTESLFSHIVIIISYVFISYGFYRLKKSFDLYRID